MNRDGRFWEFDTPVSTRVIFQEIQRCSVQPYWRFSTSASLLDRARNLTRRHNDPRISRKRSCRLLMTALQLLKATHAEFQLRSIARNAVSSFLSAHNFSHLAQTRTCHRKILRGLIHTEHTNGRPLAQLVLRHANERPFSGFVKVFIFLTFAPKKCSRGHLC